MRGLWAGSAPRRHAWLRRWHVEAFFGRVIHDRRGLLKGTRHLVYVSVLTLTGRSSDLRDCFAWAIERRVKVNRIREAILQASLFTGFPRAIHAFEILDEVLAEKGLDPTPDQDRLPPRTSSAVFFRRRGRELFEEVYRDDTQPVVARIASFQPEFMDWILEVAYGRVLGRPFLDLKTREILAVALLTVLELPRQLTPHLRGAFRAGAKLRELSEAIRLLGLFVNKRIVNQALVRLERARTTL